MDDFDSSKDQVFKNLQKMTVNDKDVNILLLGETGVGKSTFINSFANYLEYEKFNIAEENKVRCLVPAKFTVTDENLQEQIVEIGSDDNENSSIYQSATLETRSYVFPIGEQGINRIRLIDTPGIGDVRGISQDNENMENILSYISYLENLHAICFLLKPNNSRLTVQFHYCIKQLLSRLDKSASKNIIFLFTNTRGTFYKPGDTTTALKKILEDIRSKPPHTEILFVKDNVFCLDNESFRYLVAIKNKIKLGNKQSFIDSWTHSVEECWRMIHFITGKGNTTIKITPHKVKDTMSVNEARKVILQLSRPLADIADLINDNLNALERHNMSLRRDNLSISQLKTNLYVPVINLRCKELSQPTTVCTAHKCCEIYTVGNNKKYHYKQRCHDPCYLQNVPKEHIGSSELVNCYAMTSGKCRECKCDFSTHMHIYYVSETFEDKVDNEGVKAQIKDRETAVTETKKLIGKIKSRKLAYENEKDTIIKTMATFAHFLQCHAIAPYNDSYKAYLEYLIDREKSLGPDCDQQLIKYYNELLKQYDEEKKILDKAYSSGSGSDSHLRITSTTIFDSVQKLYCLPHTGEKIKELHSKQTQTEKNEHKNTEVVMDEMNIKMRQMKRNTQNKKKNKSENWNQRHQNQCDKNKIGIKQNDQPQMKAKDRRQNNNRGRNKNNSSGCNRNQQNIPNLMSINTQHFGMGNFQHQYNHPPTTQNQFQYFGPRTPVPQQVYQRLYFPGHQQNYPNYNPSQQHLGSPQHPFPGQMQHPESPRHIFPGQQPIFRHNFNFANQPIQDRHPNYPQQQNYFPNNADSMRDDVANNKKTLNDTSSNFQDPDFVEWYRNLTGNNLDDRTTQKKEDNTILSRHFNNLSMKQESDDDEDETDDSNESDQSNQEDDEEFKEFMRTHNLDYLVKPATKGSNVNKNNQSAKKRGKKGKKSCSESQNNRNQCDSDSDDAGYNDKSKTKNKGFLSNFLGMF